MKFTDPQLQRCYESNLREAGDNSEGLRQIRALMGAHQLFESLEGAHSARVHETLEHLLSAPLRPGLRRWYQRSEAVTDSAALELRTRLNQLAGEKLEAVADVPPNPR